MLIINRHRSESPLWFTDLVVVHGIVEPGADCPLPRGDGTLWLSASLHQNEGRGPGWWVPAGTHSLSSEVVPQAEVKWDAIRDCHQQWQNLYSPEPADQYRITTHSSQCYPYVFQGMDSYGHSKMGLSGRLYRCASTSYSSTELFSVLQYTEGVS